MLQSQLAVQAVTGGNAVLFSSAAEVNGFDGNHTVCSPPQRKRGRPRMDDCDKRPRKSYASEPARSCEISLNPLPVEAHQFTTSLIQNATIFPTRIRWLGVKAARGSVWRGPTTTTRTWLHKAVPAYSQARPKNEANKKIQVRFENNIVDQMAETPRFAIMIKGCFCLKSVCPAFSTCQQEDLAVDRPNTFKRKTPNRSETHTHTRARAIQSKQFFCTTYHICTTYRTKSFSYKLLYWTGFLFLQQLDPQQQTSSDQFHSLRTSPGLVVKRPPGRPRIHPVKVTFYNQQCERIVSLPIFKVICSPDRAVDLCPVSNKFSGETTKRSSTHSPAQGTIR